ncbi:hypothetical protein PoB_000075700 [Plakobranchus ocellatus]|uniref:G-protein coupled receptors family 1 profile domain-containing protein n=1 Tax=Plakobranchus ocellatus TaxID=259542 RepID=A0AAV3XUT2_9GAST|nr:hypothetical protein PoB_000075700 [Plakobranchus ocellatus]
MAMEKMMVSALDMAPDVKEIGSVVISITPGTTNRTAITFLLEDGAGFRAGLDLDRRWSSNSSGKAVDHQPRDPRFDYQSGPNQIFIAPLCPPSTKWSCPRLPAVYTPTIWRPYFEGVGIATEAKTLPKRLAITNRVLLIAKPILQMATNSSVGPALPEQIRTSEWHKCLKIPFCILSLMFGVPAICFNAINIFIFCKNRVTDSITACFLHLAICDFCTVEFQCIGLIFKLLFSFKVSDCENLSSYAFAAAIVYGLFLDVASATPTFIALQRGLRVA